MACRHYRIGGQSGCLVKVLEAAEVDQEAWTISDAAGATDRLTEDFEKKSKKWFFVSLIDYCNPAVVLQKV